MEKIFRQHQNVGAAFAQWRQGNCEHIQTIKKVFAKFFFADHRHQIAMRRCDDTHVHLLDTARAHRRNHSVLQNAQ